MTQMIGSTGREGFPVETSPDPVEPVNPMADDQLTFGQRLRQARLLAGYSQSELEDRSGIPKARLSRYENGHVLPSLGTLQKLSAALEVSEATLLGDQRAILEGFFSVLYERGVRVGSVEEGIRLAHAVADLVSSVQVEAAEAVAPPTLGEGNGSAP
ncbi:MAG: helix-turn-helix transcriptional regulator [Actinobacteria bacterium]|nr:helix-turn-helix transcriptional regulator [Actinomycetota bacterium]